MSHEQNIVWLDHMYELFNASTDGRTRALIIQLLKDNGFGEDASNLIEDWYEQRHEFCRAVGIKESDILYDDDNSVEYYIDEVENGNPGEDGYGVDTVEREVPGYLDVEYWANYTYPYDEEQRRKIINKADECLRSRKEEESKAGL